MALPTLSRLHTPISQVHFFLMQNALMIPISTTASLVDISYPNSALISFIVYYRVYSSEGGDKKAKTSFDESNVSLGRIDTLRIAPPGPHTAGSLKACITIVEGLFMPDHALYKHMKLFEDMNSDVAMNDTDVISFLGDAYPGSDEGNPVALVNEIDGPDSKFTKRARIYI
ncbi:hypothetical protein K443DRAFT_3516 [Laccaria amethystina LaAM-08-1]|uniref:Uncharacterized protein n=1 Tax=Laccaria amethystina LaAM-08-1 TaxID=1095629 RepID=A0A0C9YCV2_9AGAR|nr:hypothetical protein K443DRAFT_3516 [Laccaria amethystina LaAM-08-1]